VPPRDFRAILLSSLSMATTGSYQIHTQERGPHWISWVTRSGETKPDNAVVLVAASEAEAEERARLWAEKLTRRG
jgi:hypothetical protein